MAQGFEYELLCSSFEEFTLSGGWQFTAQQNAVHGRK